MDEIIKDRFVFCTRLHLTELTGLKASNLQELLYFIKKVPGSCIYHHTHRFLQQHQYLSPEPPNDFAYWVNETLGDKEMAEKLSSINTVEFKSIHDLREEIVIKISEHLKKSKLAKTRKTRPEEVFYFMKSASFIFPTKCSAGTLKELAGCLENVTVDSIYFHVFEARLRLEKGSNDISNWVHGSLGHKKLALEIAKLDPYTFTIDQLRKEMIRLIMKHDGEQNA